MLVTFYHFPGIKQTVESINSDIVDWPSPSIPHTSIASTDTKERRVFACRKAGKHIRMTSKEPSINEEYKNLNMKIESILHPQQALKTV